MICVANFWFRFFLPLSSFGVLAAWCMAYTCVCVSGLGAIGSFGTIPFDTLPDFFYCLILVSWFIMLRRVGNRTLLVCPGGPGGTHIHRIYIIVIPT
ncbi:hypothetical protein P170DRAFT_202765 [Aspergillus steynii IBT 23096]|uniref:Uncharacterized protein n=1 Tax=Aspergillus steynii IBT 23096 TaxID=1392250 RepID=A0A2I2G557_9EURO|nr:uncharacterized protein P170DRAFT_202765 [Aspergillus steynii IBT 23096]PLB48008.1 hypothetical protein P170DRAFT_202765 [Aspergillus steynii IBT 23096]